MGKIWRLNMKTDGVKNYGQKGLFEFCKKERIIGIGWSNPEFTKGLDLSKTDSKEIKNYIWNLHKENSWKTRGFSTASNVIVERMEKNDYTWTRSNGVYWIAQILGDPLYMRNDKDYLSFDIGFYRRVKYSAKGFHESEVPGKIISSFAARSSTQNVKDDNKQLYEYTRALFNNEENPKISLEDWISFFSASDIEEIIGLYLQIEKSLYIYTSTNKKSTAKIEFELVDKNGELYGVQVKTGHVGINGDDYREISEQMKVFLFTTSNNVTIKNNENLVHIPVDNVTKFIKNNLKLLPTRIRKWLY